MDLSINIPDNKAAAFIAFLKTIDFVKVQEKEDSFELSQKQKDDLMQCYNEFQENSSAFLSWNAAKKEISKHL